MIAGQRIGTSESANLYKSCNIVKSFDSVKNHRGALIKINKGFLRETKDGRTLFSLLQ